MLDFPKLDSFKITESDVLYEDFLTYYEEASFALELFSQKFKSLNQNSLILEVGSGINLVSHHLLASGFRNLICIEPDANGFGNMHKLSQIVSKHFLYEKNELKCIEINIEDYQTSEKFDFIFSLNVMEHVKDPKMVLKSISEKMQPLGEYYFVCPNYSFPFESHFNIPIICNKMITEKLFSRKIKYAKIPNSHDLWASLNWINVNKIKSYGLALNYDFSNIALKNYFERLNRVSAFSKRKGKRITLLAKFLRPLIMAMPISRQPIIACSVQQSPNSKRSK